MAESFAYNITEQVLDKLRSLNRPEIFSHLIKYERSLNEFEDALSRVKGVLLDADEQQANNPQLQDWLRRLKEVCYDADNVLDEIEYEALRQRKRDIRMIRNFFSSSSPIHFKMEEISGRLVEIEAEQDSFNLNERTEDRHLNERTELEEENRILPALRLSYNSMPSFLKQCFSYTSIFKMGSEIIDIELIQMWMAQGFIRPFDENQELEDIGQRYFQELCSLSFFQIVEQKPSYCTFKMYDHIHDFARSVAQDECSIVSSDGQNIFEKVQHVSLSFTSLWMQTNVLQSVSQIHNVRTILFHVETLDPNVNHWLQTYASRFKLLRVLDFGSSHIYKLPISIGKLKHLRYLNISNNRSIKMLPTSICKLLNLQSLRLKDCWELEKLPSDIGKLINLRHLLLTTKQMFLPKKGIGNLKSLRFLGIVECANLKSLGEGMQGLTALQTLLISDCRKLEFLSSSMRHLTALKTLSIENCERLIQTEWEEDIQDLRLSLQTLFITRLPQLETLPQWLQGAKDTLQLISIQDCSNFKALPEWLQYLTSLQKLEISLCPKLWTLPEGIRYLTALRELRIEDCPELNRRCEEGIGKDWPKIARVPNKIVRLARTSEMNRKRMLNKLLRCQ